LTGEFIHSIGDLGKNHMMRHLGIPGSG